MNSFLDQAGLEYFWAKIVAKIEGASVTLPKNLVKYSAVQSISATEILNATTLGGYSASYFAKASDVSDLDDSIAEQAQLLATLGPKVTALGTTVDSYETRVGNLESREDAQDTVIGQHTSALNAISTTVSSHETRLSNLTENISSQSTQINTNTQNITSLSGSMSNKLDKSGGTMSGKLLANPTAGSSYTIAQVRNIMLSPASPTSSDGSDGDIWIKYES